MAQLFVSSSLGGRHELVEERWRPIGQQELSALGSGLVSVSWLNGLHQLGLQHASCVNIYASSEMSGTTQFNYT